MAVGVPREPADQSTDATDRSAVPYDPALVPPNAEGNLLEEQDQPVSLPASSFPIVGIGASAGGLDAFTRLLGALPADTGMAFVLVQHLAAAHVSALAEILSRSTKMQVMEAEDDSCVEPNRVYVIPPGQEMVIAQGRLHLSPRPPSGPHRPVDLFFRALAEDQRHQTIGVVLSGTASDGTLGLQAIKAEGGITFAQDDTAQHDGMPQSAISSGCVDFVLPPEQIAREIVRIGSHPYVGPQTKSEESGKSANLNEVLGLLQHGTGVDFSNYKINTLYRRVTRRMLLRKMGGLAEYAQLLRKDPAEVEALYQDILINVTSFFRDPEAFETLKSKVFPRLVEKRARNDPLRVWTLGCSTGEEAYSLSMAFAEFAAAEGSQTTLKLFATDLNAAGIEKARAGVYSMDIAQDVSPERLQRFFVEVNGTYRISKAIRDACVFSRHNVLADPPFSRMDLISCRNMLIYLEPVLQKRVVPALHRALKPHGVLWLGGSETIGSYRNLFDAEDVKHKIYAKKSGAGTNTTGFPQYEVEWPRPRLTPSSFPPHPAGDGGLYKAADRILLAQYAPPGVLISSDMEILQFRGATGAYLTPAPGKASLNLLKMLREGLLVSVRAAVLRARQTGVPVREQGLRVKSGKGYRELAIQVIPIGAKGGEENAHGEKDYSFLILFEETGQDRERPPADFDASPAADNPEQAGARTMLQAADQDNARLAQELNATRDYLQSVIEQQESANEELQSANEEVQSSNEELQSINEELETSKEEIQSSNEEMAIINQELHNRNQEQSRLNNDLTNLLGSVELAVVMLGPDLRIRRFSKAAEKLLNLIPTDLGRPLNDIHLNFELPNLTALLTAVLDTANATECEVRDKRGRWYSLRLRPYKTSDNQIDGVILMLIDVDLLKRAQTYLESIVATVREPLLVLDADLRVRTASRSFYGRFRGTPETTENQLLYELDNGQWNIPDLRRLLGEALPRDNQFHDFELECNFARLGKRTMVFNARLLVQEDDRTPSILLAIEDITERKKREAVVQQRVAEMGLADRSKNEFLAMLAHELRNPLAPLRNALEILKSPDTDRVTNDRVQEMMGRQINNMTRLIDDLLDVSRITEGKLILRKEPAKLAAILTESIEQAQHNFKERDQELTVVLPAESVYLDADATRLTQVFGNLLNNAAKYNKRSGHTWLTTELKNPEDGSSALAVVRVRDDGIGLAAEDLPRIFDLFVQVDQSVERSQSGLGIGLSLVKNLVELHGGSVEVQSAGVGQGSEFIVRLPVRDITPEVSQPLPKRDGGEPAATVHRILVVDDNLDSAQSMAMLLELSGHEVRTAHDGPQAIAAATAFRPDLILLDIGLPGLNGYEVARRIREQPWGKNIMLVALTGWGSADDRLKTKEAGFNAHFVKPVKHADLIRLLA